MGKGRERNMKYRGRVRKAWEWNHNRYTGWAKKVIPLVHYITLYERYHFFGPPGILSPVRAEMPSKNCDIYQFLQFVGLLNQPLPQSEPNVAYRSGHVLEVQEWCGPPLQPCQFRWESDFVCIRRRVGENFDVLFVCFFVRHAFERQGL